MTRAAATGVPNSAPIVPASASATQPRSPVRGKARRPAHTASETFTAMIGFSGPRLGPPASTNAVASSSPGSTPSGSTGASRPVVAGSGPAWPGAFHTTSPTATPVATSTTNIHRTEYRPTPRASGRVCHRTSCNSSAAALTPSSTRLVTTPTSSAGTMVGSRARAVAAVAAEGAGCALSWDTRTR